MIFDDKGIFGFDVSFYQAIYNSVTRTWTYIDFQKMKDYGASFVIIKCGQDSYLDATFAHNWQEAKRIGIPRASYWFLDQDNQAQEQARIYWNAVKNDPGEGPLVVDYEYGSGGMWFTLYDFIAELQRLSGYPSERIWIYTGYFYWLEHRPQTLAQRAFFSQYPLWLAYYTVNHESAQCPSDWEEPVLWQKGTPAIGSAAGARSREIDYNIFNGNDLEKHFSGVSSVPQPTGATVSEQHKFTIGTNERTSPTSVSNSNLSVPNRFYAIGEIVAIVDKVIISEAEIWGKLENGRFVCLRFGGVNRTTLVAVPSPTVTLKHTFETYSDGSVKLDGTFIP